MSNTENSKNKYQLTLLDKDETEEKKALKARENLNQLFTTLEGDELVEAVIYNIHHSVFELHGWTIDVDFDDIDYQEISFLKDDICSRLIEVIAKFITDEHREAIVRYHARALPTAEAVKILIAENSIMNRLAQRDALGEEKLKELLISRLAYLKPGTARWPEKKYGAVWQEERQRYTQEINNIPFTTPAERYALLAKHAAHINNALENKNQSVRDLHSLTQTLTKTLENLEKFAPAEHQPSENLSPQMAGILERFTVALEAFQQIASSGDTNVLVEVMEKFALAMQQPPQLNAITSETDENDY